MKKVIASLLSVAMVAAMAAGCAQPDAGTATGGDEATPDASAADAGDDADAGDAGDAGDG